MFNASVGLNSITFIEKGDTESRLSFTCVCSVLSVVCVCVYVPCVFIEDCRSEPVLQVSRKMALGFIGHVLRLDARWKSVCVDL